MDISALEAEMELLVKDCALFDVPPPDFKQLRTCRSVWFFCSDWTKRIGWSIDWYCDSLCFDWPIDWSIDRLIDRLIDWCFDATRFNARGNKFWEPRRSNFRVDIFSKFLFTVVIWDLDEVSLHNRVSKKCAEWAVTSGHAVKDTIAFGHKIYAIDLFETLESESSVF